MPILNIPIIEETNLPKTTLDKTTDTWHLFLDSLATIGGNIFVLVFLWILSLGGVFHVMHYPATVGADARTLILSSFSTISGALMYALTQRQKSDVANIDSNTLPVIEKKIMNLPTVIK